MKNNPWNLILIFLSSSLLFGIAGADPIKTLAKKGYSTKLSDLKHCGEDYNAAVSVWPLSEKDRLLLCVSPDQTAREAQQQKTLHVGRNILPLMSEFVLVSKNKPTSVCTNDEVREVDCAAFIADKKIEVMITHKKMPGLQSVLLIECIDDKCEKKKGCSSQIPITASFREHKLKSFLKKMAVDAKTLQTQDDCLKTNPQCKTPNLPTVKDYTVDEQIVMVRLGLKEDNADAEKILNWLTMGKNCKDDCISADDFFEDRECKSKR